MKNNAKILTFLFFLSSICFAQKDDFIELPVPSLDGTESLEKVLSKRRSIRKYSEDSLSLSEISQILWAAQGITQKNEETPSIRLSEHRTAPSAGALYPIELYIAVARVSGLSLGLYQYNPQQHAMIKVLVGDRRADISNAALKQSAIKKAAVNIIITGVYNRTAKKYGKRAERYVQIESGAVCQNIYLQSYALGLGTVYIGAFKDDSLKATLNIPEEEYPLGIMPIGKIIKEKE